MPIFSKKFFEYIPSSFAFPFLGCIIDHIASPESKAGIVIIFESGCKAVIIKS